jgi:5'-3' exonuclease
VEYKYLIIDANNFGYRVLASSLDRSLSKVSNKFIYKNFVKSYIESVSYLKNLYKSEEVVFLFDNHTSKEELRKAFTMPLTNTRKQIKETYKLNRKRETDEFYNSLDFIKYYYIIGEKHYHTVQILKLEADDLLAPCIKTIIKNDSALLITNDSDWTRYLTNKIHYLPNQFDSPCDSDYFYSKFNFYPTEDKVILYKILFGDSSDNIPIIFPEIKIPIRHRIINEFESVFDFIINASQKDYLKEFVSLIKEREPDLKINYQLISAIPISDEQFLSHYSSGRGSERLKKAVDEIIFGSLSENKGFEFGGLKVPRVNPKG